MDVFAPYEQEQQDAANNASQAAALEAAMRQAVDGLMASPQGRLLLR